MIGIFGGYARRWMPPVTIAAARVTGHSWGAASAHFLCRIRFSYSQIWYTCTSTGFSPLIVAGRKQSPITIYLNCVFIPFPISNDQLRIKEIQESFSVRLAEG